MHVAVLMGGWSAEREVSLRSGAACADALKQAGYEVETIDVGRDIEQVLQRKKPDVAFNILHGAFGEDGGMQEVLERLRIPYTHSGVAASKLAMDKQRTRDAFEAASIPVAAGLLVSRFDAAEKHPIPLPYVVKPVSSGSSVGVFIVKEGGPIKDLASDNWQHGEHVLIEKYVAGHELTCGVLGERALDIIEITSDLAFYDYTAKYAPGGSRHILPARIDAGVYKKIQDLALRAHTALGCRGVSRSDFRYDEATGDIVCLEVNTQPGMTGTSLVPEMAAYAGLSFPQLVDWMVKDASVDR